MVQQTGLMKGSTFKAWAFVYPLFKYYVLSIGKFAKKMVFPGKKHMLFSLVFRSKVVQYPKVMMIAAFFSTLP